MISLRRKKSGDRPDKCLLSGPYLFLFVVGLLYGTLFLIFPDKAGLALKSSGRILWSLVPALCLVFVLMVLLNLFLKSSQVVRFMGEEAGLKGVLLSAAAGIISMGPIYAWYPLLKEVKQRGAGNRTIAVFLGNRAVKPFLLPIMVSYFGWVYVLLFTLFTILGSIGAAYLVGGLCNREMEQS